MERLLPGFAVNGKIRRSVGRVFESKSGERKTERTMTEVRIVIFIRN